MIQECKSVVVEQIGRVQESFTMVRSAEFLEMIQGNSSIRVNHRDFVEGIIALGYLQDIREVRLVDDWIAFIESNAKRNGDVPLTTSEFRTKWEAEHPE